MLSWQVGDVRITRILELEATGGTRFILPQATPEVIRTIPWLAPHFADETGRLRMSIHALVVETPTRRIIVDTCIGNDKQRDIPTWSGLQTSFLADLAAAGFARESIDTVLCTHLHVDHVGWNTMLVDGAWVPTFPNARYLMVREEYDDLLHAMKDGGHYTGHVPDSVQPILDAGLVDFVGSDHQVAPEMRLIPTPGHTAGHCSVLISSRGQEAVLTGDLMHHPVQCAEPDWPGNFDGDKPMAARTRRKFLEDYGDGRTLIIGAHFSGPTAGHALPEGGGWRFSVEQAAAAKVDA
jgi:glyoxylase-like metal-dependent hydrolase (beta-lactamase superfamily II)